MEQQYTPEEVAKLLKVHKQTVYRYIKSGKLKASNISMGTKKYYRISNTDLGDFMYD